MKQLFYILSLLLLTFTSLKSQGIVKEKQIIKSTILNKEVHYTIYLPSDYYTNERTYPVTYYMDMVMLIMDGFNLEKLID